MMRVAFEQLPWVTSPSGLRSKRHKVGTSELRLLEFTRDLAHPHWCATGHVGYVLEGEMEVERAEGGPVIFRAGDGVVIPGGEPGRHRPRSLTERVRLLFVEDSVP